MVRQEVKVGREARLWKPSSPQLVPPLRGPATSQHCHRGSSSQDMQAWGKYPHQTQTTTYASPASTDTIRVSGGLHLGNGVMQLGVCEETLQSFRFRGRRARELVELGLGLACCLSNLSYLQYLSWLPHCKLNS